MLSQIEGSQAVARAVTLCRPEVIAAYPISPRPTSSSRSRTESGPASSRGAST